MPRRKKSPAVTSNGELRLRELLRAILPAQKPIYNHRPDWLRGCELDIFYPRLNVAFEFNGAQHTRYVPRFHKRPGDLGAQIERDAYKRGACASRGIRLVIVEFAHTVSEAAIREHIGKALSELAATDPQASDPPKRGRVVMPRMGRRVTRDPFSLKPAPPPGKLSEVIRVQKRAARKL